MRALLFLHALAFGEPRPAPRPFTHDIVAGDTLWTLARARGCTIEELRSANPGLGTALPIGTRVLLPRCAKGSAALPKPGRAEPSAKPGAKTLARATVKPAAKPAAKKARPPEPAQHRVAAGDTLGKIARAHGITVAELQSLNGLRSTTIMIGQQLLLARAAAEDAREALAEVADDVAAEPELRALPAPPEPSDELPTPPESDPSEDDDDGVVVGRSSVGASTRGKLVGAVQLPHDKTYYLRHPKRAWGAPHVVGSTREAIASVKHKYPRVHRLAIGDISAQRGGRLSGHRSHQTGRDVDLGLYFVRPPPSYPKRFVTADAGKLDLAATWALVDAFYRQSKRPGGPVAIFLDFELQGRLYQWARKHGVSRRVLLEVFQYPHGRWTRKGLVRHEPAHDDHLHVRFGSPPRTRERH
jgi:LysM repeat protein